MPAFIDHPQPGVRVDPAAFSILGWAWLRERQGNLVAIEAWHDAVKLGEVAAGALFERPDVGTQFGIAPGTPIGFAFPARHPAPSPQPFALSLQGRLGDGTRTGPLVTTVVTPPRPEHDPLGALCARVPPGALGLEIGAHARPVRGLTPYYTDAAAQFAGTRGRVDFLADAAALPLPDATLEYLCASHVLEHLPNPLAALHEWHRVLQPGGWFYLVVPDQRHTFDAGRSVTPVKHLLRDFLQGAPPAASAIHVDEFVHQTDWSRLRPDCPVESRENQKAQEREKYLQQLFRGEPIDIHFHTFTPDSLRALLRAARFIDTRRAAFDVVFDVERYPTERLDGIALLLRKRGHPHATPAPDTFPLPPPNAAARPLPLVCPITLEPLRRERGTAGRPALRAERTGLRYPFDGTWPVLLPPPGERARRPWSRRSWRLACCFGANLRLAIKPAKPSDSRFVLMPAHIDEPSPATLVDPLGFTIRGWLWLDDAQKNIAAVEVWTGELLLGETGALYSRPDVAVALKLPAHLSTGYEVVAHHPAVIPGGAFEIAVQARFRDGTRTPPLASTRVATIARDYRANHFGILLDQRTTAVQRRGNIFAEGPSLAEGSGEVAQLLRRYLGAPPRRIIDVGCGFGSYGRGLFADGYDWLGVEVDAADCAELARLGLPHRQVDGRTLPFGDGEFDAALCLEVLEHIDEPRSFLREIQRVAPRQLIVSVPNCELLGYLWDHLAAPWHMLEADHKNFFTRWSLGALLREFYPHVELRFHTPYPLKTIEGTPLYYHLFAVATG